jgi:hypothetical protein
MLPTIPKKKWSFGGIQNQVPSQHESHYHTYREYLLGSVTKIFEDPV